MNTRPLMTLRLVLAPTRELGATPHGVRTTYPITGGSFEGERLRGRVLPGGGDWATKRSDGAIELDLRVTLETDDGALIHTTFEGLHLDDYFRTTFRFDTASPRYAFLNRTFGLGVGQVGPDGPVHVVEELL